MNAHDLVRWLLEEGPAPHRRGAVGAPRAAGVNPLRRPVLRVRRSAGQEPLEMTQREVAVLMGLSERAVRNIERRAIRKLFQHPKLREIWRAYMAGDLDEQEYVLTPEEIEALFGLTSSVVERVYLHRILLFVDT